MPPDNANVIYLGIISLRTQPLPSHAQLDLTGHGRTVSLWGHEVFLFRFVESNSWKANKRKRHSRKTSTLLLPPHPFP